MRNASIINGKIICTEQVHDSAGREAVLKTLAYFDVFQYPLTFHEIKKFSSVCSDDMMLTDWLSELELKGLVYFIQGFYLLQNNPVLCHRRRLGNERAKKLLAKATRIGRFLYRFPFVKAVGISGSLSKNFADEKADIDFFIITTVNRLWVARTLMHLYKKLTYITGRQHYYCMNYYIDETVPALPDKNIFAATEIKTMLPVCGTETMKNFLRHNQWANDYLPLCEFRVQEQADPKQTWFKKAGEGFLKNKAGDRLDNYLMRLTQKRWNKKEERGKKNAKGLAMGLISGKHFARSNPGGLQEKVLEACQQKMNELLQKQTEKNHAISSAR